jgi:phosphoribosyl-ATP pyrophosphohydrolase/phosphoribosyl-AMP cyclohydrolase
MIAPDARAIDWAKGGGLVPAIVQHADTGALLMLGYMNADALQATLSLQRVTFWSRSKGRLWTKGETSGNTVAPVAIHADCDGDTLLVLARPAGPVCHRGTPTCFPDAPPPPLAFLAQLDALVATRARERPAGSYTTKLFDAGLRRIAQKVGEEGVETALAGVGTDDAAVLDEAADLLYHLIVLLRARGLDLAQVAGRLAARHAG